MLWVGEWEAAQRQAPELALLVEAVQQRGSAAVAEELREFTETRGPRRQVNTGDAAVHQDASAAAAPWADVDTDVFPAISIGSSSSRQSLTGTGTASDAGSLRVSLDVLLVHHMMPMAVGVSPEKLAEARENVLAAAQGTQGVPLRPSAADAELAQSTAAVTAALLSACGDGAACEVADAASGRILAKVPLRHLAAAVAALAVQPAVHWLSLHVAPRTANYYGEAPEICPYPLHAAGCCFCSGIPSRCDTATKVTILR